MQLAMVQRPRMWNWAQSESKFRPRAVQARLMEDWPELRSWAREVRCWFSVALFQSSVKVAWQEALERTGGAVVALPAGVVGW